MSSTRMILILITRRLYTYSVHSYMRISGITNSDKKYTHVGHLVYSCQYHVIFYPKYRRSVLVDGVDIRFKEILIEKQTLYGYKILDMEVMPDHVHLILDVNPKIGIFSVYQKSKDAHQEY